MRNGICLKLSIGLFSHYVSKFVLFVKKSAENGHFNKNVLKKSPLWAISRKPPYRIFFNKQFWKVAMVPRNTPSLGFWLRPFWKTRPKKPPCKSNFLNLFPFRFSFCKISAGKIRQGKWNCAEVSSNLIYCFFVDYNTKYFNYF